MATIDTAACTIENIKPAIGGIVRCGKDALADPQVVAQLREALEDRTVLVFPQLHLSDEEQLAFTDRLGKRVNFVKRAPGGAGSDVYKITLDKDINTQPEYVIGTWFWHIDGVTIDQPLPKATLLTARRLSPSGGQTEFASTYAAYEALPAEEKAAIRDLKVIHRMEASMRPLYHEPDPVDLDRWRTMSSVMEHPLVWTHASGRQSLVIGSHADEVVGMPLADGRALLARLAEWAGQPAFNYRHYWQPGDLVIWDNCGAMHRVIPYDENSGRVMHRTTIGGEERVGRAAELV
jgi:alpha-ketoglutarate-dependent taurine dioxygenase